MQFLVDLWVPIVVSGLGVFIVSALVWTVMPHHKKDYRGLDSEDAVMAALRAGNPAPGMYMTPFMADMKDASTPEGKAKFEKGPSAFITIAPPGMAPMGPRLVQSLLSAILISFFVAYVAWHALPAGTHYLLVFRVTGAMTFMTYSLGMMTESIWFSRPWKSFFLASFDALLYAGVTAGVFGWLWM